MRRKSQGTKLVYVVGLMSGTSADGIDAVVAGVAVEEEGVRMKLVAHAATSFPDELRQRILRVGLHGRVAEICELNFLLGGHFAKAALGVIHKAGLRPGEIAVIGSHGQTVHHLPRAKTPSTLQIGEPCVIAERTGITTVADFRVRDMAAGGQGAPLVPYFDWAVFRDGTRHRILQNIGGIGNLTWLPPRARLKDMVAFDTGPGNMVLDAVVENLSSGKLGYDKGGKWASKGTVSKKLLSELMRHSYFSRRPPKTTGREEFGEPFVTRFLSAAKRMKLASEDAVATATALTVESIADAYERFVFPKIPRSARPKAQIILGGGGALNPAMKRMLAERIAPLEVLSVEDFGISNSAKEALAFALLAHETMRGMPSNVPAATGASRPVVLGKIVPGG